MKLLKYHCLMNPPVFSSNRKLLVSSCSCWVRAVEPKRGFYVWFVLSCCFGKITAPLLKDSKSVRLSFVRHRFGLGGILPWPARAAAVALASLCPEDGGSGGCPLPRQLPVAWWERCCPSPTAGESWPGHRQPPAGLAGLTACPASAG